MQIAKTDKIVLTGGAGLVGLNLVVELCAAGFTNLVVIDKRAENVEISRGCSPRYAGSSPTSRSQDAGRMSSMGAPALCSCTRRITGLTIEPFIRNNVEATKLVIAALEKHGVPFVIDISSSVVNSVADDFYTRTKKEQEALVAKSRLDHCCLRPTLMFGSFNPKHLGWLARFMAKTPVFPIPGDGRFIGSRSTSATSAVSSGGASSSSRRRPMYRGRHAD